MKGEESQSFSEWKKTTVQVLLSLCCYHSKVTTVRDTRFLLWCSAENWGHFTPMWAVNEKHGAETEHVDMIWWLFKNNLTFVQVYSPERNELDPFYCSCFHMIEYWDQRSKCWLSSPTDPNTNQANDSQACVTEFWGIRGVMHSCFNTRHVLFLHSRAVLCLSNLTGLHGIKYLSGAFWKMYQISVSNWCIPVADLKIW